MLANRIHFRVTNTATGRSYIATCRLPAIVGRSSEPDVQIVLPDQTKRISRMHGRFTRSGDGLTYADDSQNGSRIGELTIHDAEHPFAGDATLEIGPYRLALVDVKPIFVLEIDAQSHCSAHFGLNEGAGIALAIDRDAGLVALDRLVSVPPDIAVRLERLGNATFLICATPADMARCEINRAPVKAGRTQIVPLTVVTVDGRRFELIEDGELPIVCHNDACGLLNPYSRITQCRYCGHQLLGPTRVF